MRIRPQSFPMMSDKKISLLSQKGHQEEIYAALTNRQSDRYTPMMDNGSQRSLPWLVLINSGGTFMPDNTQGDLDSREKSGDEKETHAEVEDSTANVEKDRFDFQKNGWGKL